MADEVGIVVRSAFLSRFLLLFIQVLFSEIIVDYDSSTYIEVGNDGWFDSFLHRIFGGFGKWDAVYFLKIAEEGYNYEQYMAFFPFHPWILRTSVNIIHPVLNIFVVVKERSLLLACGWILNTFYFTAAAISLYNLTVCLFGKKNVALTASLLFCFNPASVFFSSLYTESLFCCLQFTALYNLEQNGLLNEAFSLLLFGLGCATRSNGILSCGFISHRITKKLISAFVSSSSTTYISLQNLCLVINAGLKFIVFNGIIMAPFVLFQLYGYSLYCNSSSANTINPPWCDKVLPFSYSYIQDSYWDVGFLRYFELKQIPNFLLALPMIVLCCCSILTYCCEKRNRETVKTLGLVQRQDISDHLTNRNSCCPTNRKHGKELYCEYCHHPGVLVYVFHLAFMTLFGFTSMHVQVITRFICSASPVIYWYSAHVIIRKTTEQERAHCRSKWKSLVIAGYFVLYFSIGTILHCNFHPWT